VLTSRLEAMSKKLILEIKIRDAAISLTKVNASHKKVSKQSDEQLDAANRRVDAAQKELWRVSERTHDIYKKLLEHRAGVLSLSVRSMEKKIMGGGSSSSGLSAGFGLAGEDSGYDSSNRTSTLMSPTSSSMTGMSASSRKARFDGAHLFAGHANAVTPRRTLSPEAAAAEIASLEDKLKAATESLTAAGKKQGEMTRELSLMQLEKQEVETMMGMDLQSAEETISALEKELPRLEGLDEEVQQLLQEKSEWEEERARLEARARQLEARSGGEAESSRRMLAEKDAEIQRITTRWNADREERAKAEDEKTDALRKVNEELDGGLAVLRALVKQHGIVLFSRDSSLQGLLESVGTHLENVHGRLEGLSKAEAEAEWEGVKRKLEEDVRSGLDKREALARDLEQARRERDEARTGFKVFILFLYAKIY
jgi:Up-regulated During Septation